MLDRVVARLVAALVISAIRSAAPVVQRLLSISEPVGVVLPSALRLSELLRGHLSAILVSTAEVRIGSLPVSDVTVDLKAVRLDLAASLLRRRAVVVGGHGVLRGHVGGAEVRRRSGAPAALRLIGGRAGLKLPGLLIGLRPVVEGTRVRLAPTPLTMSVPPLPPGVTLTDVTAVDDTLLLTATVDLPRLLNGA